LIVSGTHSVKSYGEKHLLKAQFYPRQEALHLLCCVVAASAFLFPSANNADAQSTWTSRTTGTGKTLRGIHFDGTQFICVADDGVITTSSDGISWSAVSSGTTNSLRGITSSPTLIVASGDQGTILTSTDGTSWSASTTPASVSTKIFSGVTYGASKFVAVGSTGKIIFSTDGATWIEATTAPPTFLQSVAFGNGKFVGVGSSGSIMHSTDGDVWLSAATGTSKFLSGLTYASGQFIVVGQSGTILTSPDAVTWSAQTAGTGAWLRAIQYADSRFLIVGDGGTVLTSEDAILWEAQSSGISESGFGLAYGDGKFVSAGGKLDFSDPGFTSQIITSPTGLDLGFRWNAVSGTVTENGGPLTFDVLRIGPDTDEVSAQWSVTGGTATATDDFTEISGQVDFASGESSKQLTISLVDDSLVEGDETLTLTLAPLTAGWRIHGPVEASVTIIDDEDTDNDGLEDSWELNYFSSIALYDGDDDPDNDSNKNHREFSDGTDPDSAASALYHLSTVVESGSGSISTSPAGPFFSPRENIQITATPASGFLFEKWTNAGFPQTNPVSITLTGDTVVTARFILTLAESLDQSGLDWIDNTFLWRGQTVTTFDSEDAAFVDGNQMQSGDSAVLETFVPGNVTVSFRWKTSTAADADYLRLFIDDELVNSISGETGWIEKSVNLLDGVHFLSWDFERSFGLPAGSNAVWLDTVKVTQSFSQWQNEHFSPAEILAPLISGMAADPDADGQDNFQEYAFGSSPWNPRALTVSLTTTPALSLVFERPYMLPNTVDYILETSNSLLPASWSVVLAADHQVASKIGTLQTIRITEQSVPLSQRLFYRLRAQLK
jgi:hypothetical protein